MVGVSVSGRLVAMDGHAPAYMDVLAAVPDTDTPAASCKTTDLKELLADAEGGEDLAEHVVRGELAGDFAEGFVGLLEFFGEELAGAAGFQLLAAGGDVAGCTIEGVEVAAARNEQAFGRVGPAGQLGHALAEFIDTGAGYC